VGAGGRELLPRLLEHRRLFGGIAPVPATTLNRPEKVRSAAGHRREQLGVARGVATRDHGELGDAMFELLGAAPVTLTYTSVPGPPVCCAGDGHGAVSARNTTSIVAADVFRHSTD